MIEIYGKTFCPYCDKAKALCEREGFEYSYKELDKDFTREEFFNIFPTARTFPQIKIDGNDSIKKVGDSVEAAVSRIL